jgi:hypothetical protein
MWLVKMPVGLRAQHLFSKDFSEWQNQTHCRPPAVLLGPQINQAGL